MKILKGVHFLWQPWHVAWMEVTSGPKEIPFKVEPNRFDLKRICLCMSLFVCFSFFAILYKNTYLHPFWFLRFCVFCHNLCKN